MRNERKIMKTKTCLDCLHCKVSSNSTKNSRLCFCSVTKSKERYLESYWLAKSVCKKFVDMSEKSMSMIIIPTVALKRRPLFRKGYRL
jgi:hypothetical protein